MDLGLQGKIVIVTGAGRGIGLATVRALVAEGAIVVAGSRSSNSDLEALRRDGRVTVHTIDLASPGGPASLIRAALETHGGIDILVNNLGRGEPRTGFLNVPDEAWDESFALNFLSAMRACREVIPSMLERGAGTIVNVSSVNGFLPNPRLIDYSAAKAALKSLSKSLSEEFGPRGIRVNTISPGPTNTPAWLDPETGIAALAAEANQTTPEAILADMAGNLTLRRFSEPEEIAALIVFVASGVAGSITGSDLVIDSGRVKTM